MIRAAVALAAVMTGSPALAQEEPFRVYEQLPGIGFSLLLVVALIVAAAWLLRRTPLGAFSRANGPLKVVATLPLGPKERLVLVETGGTQLLLGVGPAGISRLDAPTAAGATALRTAPAAANLRELLQERC